MATKLSKPKRIALIALGCIVGLVVVVIVGFNIYIRVSCNAFYNEAKAEFPVPESHSGFVVQDLDHVDKADIWLFSGYMHNNDVAPVVRRDAKGVVSKVYVKLLDGQLYGQHHGSGITSTDEYTFLTTDSGYVVMRTDDLVNASDGDVVDVIAERELGLGPAFLSISNGVLYTGEFYFPVAYETPESHRMTTPDGSQNPAIMYAFDPDPDGFYGFSELPSRVYSLPDAVQGVCVTDQNKMVLSCSWGVSNSHLLVYDLNAVMAEGDYYYQTDAEEAMVAEAMMFRFGSDGATLDIAAPPLYYLDSRTMLEDIVLPPMSEGITVFDGRVFIPNESASNKYIFGKLVIGADMVYSIQI